MEKELRYLGMALEAPERPFVAVLGGAKVSDKIEVIESLLPRVDALLVGGGMAYTFFRAQGLDTRQEPGRGRQGRPRARAAREGAAASSSCPSTTSSRPPSRRTPSTRTLPVAEIPDGWMGLDIGPQTARAFADEAGRAKLVLWNGPMGVFEMEPFAEGTLAVARGARRQPRHHDRRRRRQRRRGHADGPRRQDQPRLDRRRRVARVPERRAAARRRLPARSA